MISFFEQFDQAFRRQMQTHGISILRVALGIVYIWFGLLKVLGVSPVATLLSQTYSFFPQKELLLILGVWEVAIGLGLVFNKLIRLVLASFWLQMAGILFTPFLAPTTFFTHSNPLLLTLNGEFVVKNLVLIAASIVIGGHFAKEKLK